MKLDQFDTEAVVGRSREISEARWPGIKDELDLAKSVPLTDSATCVEPEDRDSFVPQSRRTE